MLFIVPTPIGNLDDITLRAIKTLKDADLILAEDTRVSGKLLKHFDIGTPMRPFHSNNEHRRNMTIFRDDMFPKFQERFFEGAQKKAPAGAP